LDPDLVIIDAIIVRAFGGGEHQAQPGRSQETAPGHPHDAAHATDHRQIIPLVMDFPKVTSKPGRPKELPDAPYADRGYDQGAMPWLLPWLGIEPHIPRRKTPHGSGLGKIRWVVERTISWRKGLRPFQVPSRAWPMRDPARSAMRLPRHQQAAR
jgi:hypothetical protein